MSASDGGPTHRQGGVDCLGLEHSLIALPRENHLSFFQRGLHCGTSLTHPLSSLGFRGRRQRSDLSVGQS